VPPSVTDPDSHDTTPTVTVRGESVLRTEPDEALLWITLSALESDPGQALADVSRRSDALVVLLDEVGIAKRDRATTGVTIHEEFDHTPSGRRSLGHRAAASVSARFTDPEPIGQVISRATTELGARIDGPRWQIAARNPIHLEAAREAAADGRRKAQAFAEGVGAKVGRLIRLVEADTDYAGPRMRRARMGPMAVAASAGEPMPIEPGEHEVSAAIDVTFALEPS
jgi:uncharacterized protein YggE